MALKIAGARVSVENAQRRMRAGRKEKLERFELILGGEASYSRRGRRRPSGASTRTDGLPGATELLAATRKTTASPSISNRYPADFWWTGKWALAWWAAAR
jgi:hypothetical protein